jgi:type IV secretory pathway TraG/TraD family ATPase VirD4
MNQNRKYIKAEKRVAIVVLAFSFFAALAFTVWAGPMLATWTLTGHWPHLSYGNAVIVATGTIISIHNVTRHWPADIRQASMAYAQWWLTIFLLVATQAAVATGVLRYLDNIASQPVADRRWWQLKGISPRTFGRTHTIAPLLVDRRKPDDIVIGTHQGRRLAIQKNHHLLTIAPPRSGKTAGIIIPALLDHTGPVVSTSVRTDVRDHTISRRSELGDVFQWDPFSLSGQTDFYDPIHACQDWGHALRVARWFTGAVSLSSGGSQDYFNAEAKNLLAPFIHAAAWHPQGSINNVFDWLERKDPADALAILDMVGRGKSKNEVVQQGCAAAIAKLQGTFAYNERQLDGLIGTARVFLEAYGHPKARATAETWRAGETHRRVITPEAVFGRRADGLEPANTLYIVADTDDQKQLAPIIVMMLSEMLYFLGQQYNRRRELPVSAMFALDEAGQIAPLEDLTRIMSASLPNARFLTIWHSVSQIQDRYGAEAAREILAHSQAKIVLASNTDGETVGEVNRLIGQLAGDQTFNPEIQTAQAMQRISDEQGILIHSNFPVTVFDQRRYYKDPILREMADDPDKTTEPLDVASGYPEAA